MECAKLKLYGLIPKISCTFVLLFLIISSCSSNVLAVEEENNLKAITSDCYKQGYRYNIQGFVYIHIEGEAYERGYQYGYLAAAEIVDMMNRWSQWGYPEDNIFWKIFLSKNLPEKWWDICKKRAVKYFWDQYPEEYQQEIQGIADGVKDRGGTIHGQPVTYEDVLTLNEIEETRQTYANPGGRGHPIRLAINMLKPTFKNIFTSENYDPGHCSAFVATGDATIDGRIIMTHSTIIPSLIGQRSNIILDVKPSNGNRFIMTCFPGYIWSSQDFYENEKGIMLAETSWYQGPYKIKNTIPTGVRARLAIQYSDSIDKVIDTMIEKNNGLYPNDWIMGDTKTGEIASLELGFRHHAITRTKNGFLWSCNNPKDDKVRWEPFSIFGFGIPGRIFFKMFIPNENERDLKFKELKDEYYGKIDMEIAKKIMATPPINKDTWDCKITDSSLLKNLGFWAHMGNADGKLWVPTEENKEKLKGVTEGPGTGWVKIFASKSQPDPEFFTDNMINTENQGKVLWTYQTQDYRNADYASLSISGKTLYVSTSTSSIYAINPDRSILWNLSNIGEKTVEPAVSNEYLYIGTEQGIYAINKETGKIEWKQTVGDIANKPIVTNNLVITSCTDGNVYAFNSKTGKTEWKYSFTDTAYISTGGDNNLYIASGDTCYYFDSNKKELIWNYKTDGIITNSPTKNKDTIYFGSWDGNLYAIHEKTGKIKWKFQTGWGIDTKPYIKENIVYFGSNDNRFYALDEETGGLRWFFTCKSGIHSNPIVYGDYVFFGSDDGRLYALDKNNGEAKWSFAPGYTINDGDVNNYITTPILSDPVVEDGVVYISAKGIVYALDAQTKENVKESPKKIDNGFNFGYLIILLLVAISIVVLLKYFKRKK